MFIEKCGVKMGRIDSNFQILIRERINKMLDKIFETSFFLITASIGYGKTTAVQNYLKNRDDIDVIYFSASVGECSGVWTWKKFCRTAQYINENLGKQLGLCQFPKSDESIQEIVEVMLDNIFKETVIVLDDWEEIRSETITDLFERIAFENIPFLHIVLISRNMPKMKYIEYEMKKKCIIMWQEDLEFTLEDTKKLFEINGFKLDDAESKYIYNYTSGWTTPTYLSLFEYSNKGIFKSIPKATKLIRSAIKDRFDDESITILLKLSLFQEFSLDEALYVINDKRAVTIIKELYDDNFFIRYDCQNGIYNFHQILKIALNEEIKGRHIDEEVLFNRAGEWFMDKKQPISAIRSWDKCKNYEAILKILESDYMLECMNQEYKFIVSVFDKIDEELKLKHPFVYISIIYYYILGINKPEGKELLYKLKCFYEENKNALYRNQILGEIAIVESSLYISDIDIRIKYLKKAQDYLSGNKSNVIHSGMSFTRGINNIICLYYKEVGNLDDFAEKCYKNIKYYVDMAEGFGTGADYLLKAEIEFSRGNIEQAQLKARKSFYKAESKGQTSILVAAEFLLMRIDLCMGNVEKVKERLRKFIEKSKKYKSPLIMCNCHFTIGYINGLLGNYEEIPLWIKNNDMSEIVTPEAIEIGYILYGLSILVKGDYIALEVLVESMLDKYDKSENIIGKIYAYIYGSIAKYNLYGLRESENFMEKAIELAIYDEIYMPFVELSYYSYDILKRLVKNKAIDNILEKINKYKIYRNIHTKESKEINELTERELAVMELIYSGYKQNEIAASLNISLNTVRYHTKNIYDKFAVKNKVSAIQVYTQQYIDR